MAFGYLVFGLIFTCLIIINICEAFDVQTKADNKHFNPCVGSPLRSISFQDVFPHLEKPGLCGNENLEITII
jgi:hypothetical protein